MIWFLRSAAVVGLACLGYFQLYQDVRGVLLGGAVGLAIVGLEAVLGQIHLATLIFAAIGVVIGLIAARGLDATILSMGSADVIRIWSDYAIIARVALIYLGLVIALKVQPDLESLDKDLLSVGKKRGRELKVLDTSSIIDGRVADICDTKFLAGTLVVPRFVMQELHGLADSSDSLVRARGRRGLDILARLQENPDVTVQIYDRDVPEVQDVDGKLVRLAKELNGLVITSDFNLHKIAALEGVPVLSVNDLSAALKPVVLPGEAMTVFVMKEGKEKDQGVAYLDDGTMVVVEDGRRHIGKRIDVSVASILQTSAGRMIFSKAKPDKERGERAEPRPEARPERPEHRERPPEHRGDRPEHRGERGDKGS